MARWPHASSFRQAGFVAGATTYTSLLTVSMAGLDITMA